MTGKIDWSAAIWASLIAGFVFIVLEMVLIGVTGAGSPMGPPRMIAAIGLGQEVLPPPATFDLGVFFVGMLIHFVLSVILGVIFSFVAARQQWKLRVTMLAGVGFGLLVYLINFYGFSALFPWFANARTSITVFAHIVFGLVLGWAYHGLAVKNYVDNVAQPPSAT